MFFVSIFEVPAQAPVTSNSNCSEERCLAYHLIYDKSK